VTVNLLSICSVVPLIFPPICSVQTRSAAPTAALPRLSCPTKHRSAAVLRRVLPEGS